MVTEKYDLKRCTAHEMGHFFEARIPGVREAVTKWRDSRTQGETLKWLGPGYGQQEKAKKDKFSSAYIGKEYSDGSTEVFSMGYSSLLTGQDWGKDPEMDEMIIGVLMIAGRLP